MPTVKKAAGAQPTQTKKIPWGDLKSITNQEMFDLVKAYNPGDLDRIASLGGMKWMQSKSAGPLTPSEMKLISDYLGLTMKVIVQKFDIPRVRSIWRDANILETYTEEYGGITQRLAGSNINPTSPKFLPEYKNSSDPNDYSPDRPRELDVVNERFFQFNDAYQSVITFANFPIKQAFYNNDGVATYEALYINGLQNGRILDENAKIAKVFMDGITKQDSGPLTGLTQVTEADAKPLRGSQLLEVDWPANAADKPTDEQVRDLVFQLKFLMSTLTGQAATGQFNEGGYVSTWDKNDFTLVLRTGIEDRLTTTGLLPWGLEGNGIQLPYANVAHMNDFGNIQAFSDAEHTTRLYPVYDNWGGIIDNVWNTTPGTSATYENGKRTLPSGAIEDDGTNVFFKDPYADVIGFIVQKGRVFIQEQTPYDVIPHFNPLTLKTSYIASQPMRGINYDNYYNVIVLKAKNGQA